MTEPLTHAPTGHDHAAGTGCCSDTPESRARLHRARVLVAGTGAAVLLVAVVAALVGGWIGAAVLSLIAVGILATVATRWATLSLNDRLMPLAIAMLLVVVALVRAFPR